MSKKIICFALLALGITVFLHFTQHSAEDAFDKWKSKYGVTCPPQQESYRRIIFEQKLLEFQQHNADPSQTYRKGINQFSALTQAEFVSTYLGAIPPEYLPAMEGQSQYDFPNGDINWAERGMVTPVKNQRRCGSCWAFSVTGIFESF